MSTIEHIFHGVIKGKPGIEIGSRLLGKKGADIASANDLTLGSDGNYFEVTGSTQINGIATAGWTAGSIVHIFFGSGPLLKNNGTVSTGYAPMFIQKNDGTIGDVTPATNSVYKFIFIGTSWLTSEKTAW